MSQNDDAPARRAATLERLALSRAEIRRWLEPPPKSSAGEGVPGAGAAGWSGHEGSFPRSRTMKMLMSGRGLGTVGAMVGGLLIARPALALRVLRMLPTGAVARLLLVKAIEAMRSRQK